MRFGIGALPYLVFLATFFVPFLAGRVNVLPGPAILVFELVSGFIFLVSILYLAVHRSILVKPKYLVLFLIVCLHFTAGIILNSVDAAVVFSGIRGYLKYVPLFILPLVYPFSESQINGQLKFLVALGLLQFPFLIVEKYILHWENDLLAGTMGIGSIMSIYLICIMVVLAAFYFCKRISAMTFILLTFVLFIPTTLNETKSTVILIVVGMLVVILGSGLKKTQIIAGMGVVAAMLAIFIVVYSYEFGSQRATSGKGLYSFIMEPDTGIIHYLYSGDSEQIDTKNLLEPPSSVVGAITSLEAQRFDDNLFRARRLDSIILPIRTLSGDPIKLLLGLGIGNASPSKINLFAGQYAFVGRSLSSTAVSQFLWEIGIFGLILYLIFFYFIYRDARYLARSSSGNSALGLGWAGVVAIVVVTLPYKNIFYFDTICSLFWYLSGYIVAERCKMDLKRLRGFG